MKKLTKIKLINWHGFINETIFISNNAVIFGENGCGKSTLIDAINYLITGGNNKFNTAANQSTTKRTLETYIRGKTGAEGKEYLRPGSDVISHIALEFFDEELKTYSILGVVLEIRDNSNRARHFFYAVDDYRLKEELFINNNEVLNYKTLSKIIASETQIIEYSGSQEQIRNGIKKFLNISDSKYYELLPKAIAFSPIQKVDEFVYQYLMPEKNIDLETLKSSVNSYRDIKKILDSEEAKKIKLEEIVILDDSRIKNDEKICFLDYLITKNNKSIKDSELVNINSELANSENKLYDLTNEIDLLNKKIREFDALILDIERSNIFSSIKELSEKIEVKKQEKKRIENRIEENNKIILEESAISNEFDLDYGLKKFLSLETYSEFKTFIQNYKKDIDGLKEEITDDLYNLEDRKKPFDEKKKSIVESLEKLNRFELDYRDNVLTLKNLIKEEIKKKYNVESEIISFNELLEIKDEKYRDALEGYLANKRFDLFVEPKYYELALDVYNKYKNECNIHGIGIVNVRELKDQEINPNSLFNEVKTLTEAARLYALELLNNVYFDDNYQNKTINNVTSDVFIYDNHRSYQVKKTTYESPYIGKNSIKIRIEKLKNELESLDKNILKLNEEKEDLLRKKRLLSRSKCDEILHFQFLTTDLKNINQEIIDLEEKIAEIEKTNSDLAEQANRLDLYREERDKLIEKSKECNNQISYVKAKRMNLEKEKNQVSVSIQELIDKIKIIENDSKFLAKKEIFLIDFKDKTLKEILSLSDKLKEESQRLVFKIENKMTNFISEFNFDSVATIENIKDFRECLNISVQRNLIEYGDKAYQCYKEALAIFKSNYIDKIRDNITQEQQNIAKLNKTLKSKPFGTDEEIYEFIIERSHDNDFGRYYDIFVSNRNYDLDNLFGDVLSDSEVKFLETLFERFTTDSNNAKDIKLLNDYTDYRKFMHYDIKITNKYKDVTYFSKINKEKSGGETQTPFYVIIAASFDQIAKSSLRKRGSATLVIFDEAFNNMDESRIEAMIEYFNTLSVQFLIVVPTLRSALIQNYVETRVSIRKIKNISCPYVSFK